jgi:hypothetical protein
MRIDVHEIVRHLIRHDGQRYAWFRIKEAFFFSTAEAGPLVTLWLFISASICLAVLGILHLANWCSGLSVETETIKTISYWIGCLASGPPALYCYKQLVKEFGREAQEKWVESMKHLTSQK